MRAEIGHMPSSLDESITYRGKVVYFVCPSTGMLRIEVCFLALMQKLCLLIRIAIVVLVALHILPGCGYISFFLVLGLRPPLVVTIPRPGGGPQRQNSYRCRPAGGALGLTMAAVPKHRIRTSIVKPRRLYIACPVRLFRAWLPPSGPAMYPLATVSAPA